MSLLEFKENLDHHLIPSDSLGNLCDFDKPMHEASIWVDEQVIMSQKIIVVGLGAGFHIQELAKKYPNMEILVIDTRPKLLTTCKFLKENSNVSIQIVQNFGDLAEFILFEEMHLNDFEILSFKKSWGSEKNTFQEIYWFLTFRTFESFQLIGALHHLKVKSLPQHQLISLKDLYSEKVNLTLSALQELIR